MSNRALHPFATFLPILLVALLIAFAVSTVFSLFKPSNPPLTAADAQSIAKYRKWLRENDLPLIGGKIKAEDIPGVYGKLIEHDVQADDLKSARSLIGETIGLKLDAQVLTLSQQAAAKELIVQVQRAHEKVAALNKFLNLQMQPTGSSGDEYRKAGNHFRGLPFSPTACPEQAEEIASIYRTRLQPIQDRDRTLESVVAEIEQRCLPRGESGTKP